MKKSLLARLRTSATRVNPKARRSFKALAKAHGVSKKTIKEAFKRPKADSDAAVAGAAMVTESPEPEKGFPLREVLARGMKLKKVFDQLRTTGGRRLRRKK